MTTQTTSPQIGYYLSSKHAGSIAALGPDAKEFFPRHGYSQARLARRCRVAQQTMQAFFAGRVVSARIVRNLSKLRAALEARTQEGPPHEE